jgi:hypothetical protein
MERIIDIALGAMAAFVLAPFAAFVAALVVLGLPIGLLTGIPFLGAVQACALVGWVGGNVVGLWFFLEEVL